LGLRKTYLPWLACAVIAAVGIPALAWGNADAPVSHADAANGSFLVYDNGFYDASGTNQADTTVNITPGSTVTFSYPGDGNNSSSHNVAFDDGSPTPDGCVQTAGDIQGPVPPMPTYGAGPGWSGYCTFNSPGTYTFHCALHPEEMKGTIIVSDGSATPTP